MEMLGVSDIAVPAEVINPPSSAMNSGFAELCSFAEVWDVKVAYAK